MGYVVPSITTTMITLTPACLSFNWQVSQLNDIYLLTIPSPTTLYTPALALARLSAKQATQVWVTRLLTFVVEFGLHLVSGGSTVYPAESSSLSYGLVFRFRLLSTPPCGDAVTFGYRA